MKVSIISEISPSSSTDEINKWIHAFSELLAEEIPAIANAIVKKNPSVKHLDACQVLSTEMHSQSETVKILSGLISSACLKKNIPIEIFNTHSNKVSFQLSCIIMATIRMYGIMMINEAESKLFEDLLDKNYEPGSNMVN